MNIPACDKYGNPKNVNPFKKNYRRKRFPNYKTFIRLGMDKKVINGWHVEGNLALLFK